jgi:hypothetical protein
LSTTPRCPQKGRHSVGVAPQYASSLGKNANCQTLVSLTLASGEVPVRVGLRLFLRASWTSDPARLVRSPERSPVSINALELHPLSLGRSNMAAEWSAQHCLRTAHRYPWAA